jgi:hypothetical protein
MSTPHDHTVVIVPAPVEQSDAQVTKPLGAILATIIVTVALILVTALALAEWIARSEVEHQIGDDFRTAAGLPSTQRVSVQVGGLLLPQLLLRRFDEVVVASDNVNVGPIGGDLLFTFQGVPLEPGDAEIGSARGEVHFSAVQASALLPSPGVVDVSISDTEISFGIDLAVGGQSMPLALGLTPGFDGGRVTTAVSSLTLGETTLTAADAAAQLGPDAAASMQPASFCVADALPVGVRVTDVLLRQGELVIAFDVDPRTWADPALQTPGVCA